MFKYIKDIKKFRKKIKNISDIKNIKKIEIKYLGKNGYINNLIQIIKTTPKKKKSIIGKKINKIKKYIIYKINFYKKKIYKKNKSIKNIYVDLSLPGKISLIGNMHPITYTINKIEDFFIKLGFIYIKSEEIENKYYNFDLLNINKYHPSRSLNDTFWINKNILLRTHTSSFQIKYMKKNKPPIKIITSGNVFRKDDDSTHTPMFHQLDCLIIEKNINFSNLKYLINKFINFFFKKKIKIKFVPSYFPFTEPSAEVFIKNNNNKWIEILGCGLVHPIILKNVNINTKIYSGLAFGIGIERLIMLKYNIKNIKTLYKNNIKLLEQF